MFKKIIVGILLLTVFGAAGAALAYNAATKENETATARSDTTANNQRSGAQQHGGQGNQGDQGQGNQQQNGASQANMGEPWQASGTIASLDEVGLNLITDEGKSVYVELGPAEYWQSQDVVLEEGQTVSITGSIEEDMIHAIEVSLDDGQILTLRTDFGQPLWSGGADHSSNAGHGNSRGSQGNQNQSHGEGETQVSVDEWTTIEGTLISYQGGRMTMSTIEGNLITFQTGQPRFFASQGVTFQVGDEIEVLGYYQNEQFMAGEITQNSTGLWVMLRDPNGRPLWAGPGNGSDGSGNTSGTNGSRWGGGHS